MHDEHPTPQSESHPQTSEPARAATPSDETPPETAAGLQDEEATATAASPTPTGGDADNGDDIGDDDVAELRRERDEHYQRLLRTTAEFDNYRKRTERERRDRAEYAATDLLTDLLPIVDDLERALAAKTKDADVYRRGVEIIQKQLLDLLERRGVTPIQALGADFDPNVHQAVTQEPSDRHRDGEVIEELRRGYTMGDRLLRPAMVKVAQS